LTMSRGELLKLLDSNKKPGVDFLLVDLRRADHEVRNTGAMQAKSTRCNS